MVFVEIKPPACVLCYGLLWDPGHNPDPLAAEGQCCDECNSHVLRAHLLLTEIRQEIKQRGTQEQDV
jgi:hypothetical protein